MRFAPVSIALLIVASFTLSSCAGETNQQALCEPVLNSGSLTESITVTPEFGVAPSLEIPEDTRIEISQRERITAPVTPGRFAQDGDLLSINFSVIDAETGADLDGTAFDSERGSAPVLLTEDFSFSGLYKGLLCAQPGERLLIAVAPEDGLGEGATAEWGISPESTLLMVIDVVEVTSTQAQGQLRQLPNGFPNVVSTSSGQVGVVLPPSMPPLDVRVSERIVGEGVAVKAEDIVFGQALSVDWATRSVLSSTWIDGSPTSFGTQAEGADIRGFLTGLTLGSQVVLILPSPTGATVHVVDILAVG